VCPHHNPSFGEPGKEDVRERKNVEEEEEEEEEEEGDIQQRTKSEFRPTRIRKYKPLLQQRQIQLHKTHQKLN